MVCVTLACAVSLSVATPLLEETQTGRLSAVRLAATPTFSFGVLEEAEAAPPGPSFGRSLLVATTGTVAFVGATAVGVAGGATLPTYFLRRNGRPEPLAYASALAIGWTLTFAISHLLMPELTRLADDALFVGSPVAARAEGFRHARWAALAGLVGIAGATAGGLLEHAEFGRGQLLMLSSAALAVTSLFVYGALEIVGMMRGHRMSRVPRGSVAQ
nr:hypothetical protein [uncultured bacterium]